MEFNNVDVMVSGPNKPSSTYKTKILKGNHSFASQITEANTKYVIKYNFDLNGETVTIPANCILEFDGGSISNGELVGQDTAVCSNLVKIFNADITFNGTWNITEIYIEWFGAKGDDTYDCTTAFELAMQFADVSLGGIIKLLNGIYKVDTITTGYKTSIIGKGIGVSIIHIVGQSHGIVVPVSSRAIKLEDFTIIGNQNSRVGDGIRINMTAGEATGEHHEYITSQTRTLPSYSWIIVNRCAIYYFATGLYVSNSNFGFICDNCYICFNENYGVYWSAKDSELKSCYIGYNGKSGIYFSGSNNKVSNLKVINNYYANTDETITFENAAVVIKGSRNTFSNVEAQDNFCSSYYIEGKSNSFVNCISNSDGCFLDENNRRVYNSSVKTYSWGFKDSGIVTTNQFVNCGVNSYGNCYIAYPIYIPQIDTTNLLTLLNGIQINDISTGASTIPIHRESMYVKDTLHCKGNNTFSITQDVESKYFEYGEDKKLFLGNIDILSTTFVICLSIEPGDAGIDGAPRIMRIYRNNTLFASIVYSNHTISFYMPPGTTNRTFNSAQLKTSTVSQDIVVAFSIYKTTNTNARVQALYSYYNSDSGYSYIQDRRETENSFNFQDAAPCYIDLGDTTNNRIKIKKILVSKSKAIVSDVLVGGNNLFRLYKDCIAYVSADNFITVKENSGNVRPNGVSIGYQYFDTTLNKPIYWTGTAWVDATGATV